MGLCLELSLFSVVIKRVKKSTVFEYANELKVKNMCKFDNYTACLLNDTR